MRPGTSILFIFVAFAVGSGAIAFAWPTSLEVAAKGYIVMLPAFIAATVAGLSIIGIGVTGLFVLQRYKQEWREEVRQEYESTESADNHTPVAQPEVGQEQEQEPNRVPISVGA